MFANIFVNNVLPVFLVMAAGVILDRALHIEIRSLARVALYVLAPALIFSRIVQSSVAPGEFGLMILFVFVITLAMCAIALIVGRLLRWPASAVDALVLSVAFFNAGNFGLSVVLFSFGEAGLQLATVFFVGSNFTANTLAAFFAARGGNSSKQALLKVLRLPGLYAFLLALLLRALEAQVPEVILKPLSTIAGAYVPMMLMMLGLQLSQTKIGHQYTRVAVGVFIRLVVGALVAVGLAPLVGLRGLARQVAITQSATPTAVNSALMAIEFDADPQYVTSAIFFSTLLSSLTLTILLAFLKA